MHTDLSPKFMSPREVCERLAACGLIRVTDLPMWELGNINRQPMYFVKAPRQSWGKYCSNNGYFVVVTHLGDTWWGEATQACAEWVKEARIAFCDGYGYENRFISVPASNGEQFLLDHLVQRHADPYAEPRRGWTPFF